MILLALMAGFALVALMAPLRSTERKVRGEGIKKQAKIFRPFLSPKTRKRNCFACVNVAVVK